MNNPIRVNVDVTNPGQFFACCGLLELADRLSPGAEGWFEDKTFCIKAESDLAGLVRETARAELHQIDPGDDTSSALEMKLPGLRLRLDWWRNGQPEGREMKVWAGTMHIGRIARAMQSALKEEAFRDSNLLNIGQIVYDPDDPEKKVEPFYFDARRGPNAHSRDVGFCANDLQLTTIAHPAVEFFCLVGLQRCLPARTTQLRMYDYCTWQNPILPSLLRPVVAGCVLSGSRRYRFENGYRSGQKKQKAFRPAIPFA
jgi:CRISPR-associated protein Csx14